jgi:prepilin-type processing-associated H-X9-DG protein
LDGRFSGANLLLNTGTSYYEPLRTFSGTKVFVCPTDTKRSPTTNILQSTNLSYFLNLSARPDATNQVLLGDRHLARDGAALGSGQVRVPVGASLNWTQELHPTRTKVGQGIVSFVDGHAEHLRGGAPVSAAFGRFAGEKWLLLP